MANNLWLFTTLFAEVFRDWPEILALLISQIYILASALISRIENMFLQLNST